MRTAIEQARIELSKWEARVAEDTAALDAAEREAAFIRDRLNTSKRAAVNLRYAVQQWDKWHADSQQHDAEITSRQDHEHRDGGQA